MLSLAALDGIRSLAPLWKAGKPHFPPHLNQSGHNFPTIPLPSKRSSLQPSRFPSRGISQFPLFFPDGPRLEPRITRKSETSPPKIPAQRLGDCDHSLSVDDGAIPGPCMLHAASLLCTLAHFPLPSDAAWLHPWLQSAVRQRRDGRETKSTLKGADGRPSSHASFGNTGNSESSLE
jgi:hypothetical protein